ncbi:uncharacterized protein LOC123473667 isoform X2 [Daphnia magna]|nr:uncharacterized protein LOC123473667 isoform X2 [Daphnia magna]
MLMSLNGYRDQAVLRHRKRSVIFQWLTAIFLFVNLVACLTLISAICNQNELLKATRSNEEGVYFTPNINTAMHNHPATAFQGAAANGSARHGSMSYTLLDSSPPCCRAALSARSFSLLAKRR